MPANILFPSAEARAQNNSKGVKAQPMGLDLIMATLTVPLFKIGIDRKGALGKIQHVNL